MTCLGLPAAIFFALIVTACGDNAGKDLFETAQFEEKQNNVPHAKELYQEILTKYPHGEYARKAEARLQQLNEAK
jgi:outer membrane protein assembly factor BamD (BamD/ComL family)